MEALIIFIEKQLIYNVVLVFRCTANWLFCVCVCVCVCVCGFLGSSAGKEPSWNAGAPASIPGSGRSPREGIGYPCQYSWASLVAQMVKNPFATHETWVRSQGWENPLEDGMATHSNILAWRIPMARGARWATVHGVTRGQTWLSS